MNRRTFVLGAGGALSAGVGVARENQNRLRLGRSYVTNMEQFSGTAHPAAGEEMVLRRNTDRQFDPRSIEVRTEMSQVLGYLPPAFSGMLATIMDDGHPAFAVAIEGGDSSQMNVEIFLDMRA